jgi:ubiquinone/menaquinone biosynthesis C-methylase UbiE
MDYLQRLMLERACIMQPNAASILEVGYGRGAFLADIAAAFSGASLSGIDTSEKAIQYAQRSLRPRVHLQVASIERAPFGDGTFDLVFACKTFHHWSDKQQGLREVARVLKPGGILLLGDAFADGPLRHRWIHWIAEKTDGGTFTRSDDMRCMFDVAGLRQVEEIVVPNSGRFLSVNVIAKD